MAARLTARGRSAAEGPAVVIVSWNVRALLERCLAALAAASAPLRVIVVDNASGDRTVEMLAARFPDVEVIANRENIGFTRGNNQALRRLGFGAGEASSPEMVLLLNPDTEVAPGAVERLANALAEHPSAGIVGPLLRNSDGTVQSSRRRFPSVAVGFLESTPFAWHWPDNPVARRYRMGDALEPPAGPVDWVTGAAMLVRGRALQDVGLFDEGYFMYSEEMDLCYRLHGSGWEVRFEPAAEVLHHEGRSSEQVAESRHRWFHRSRVRWFRLHRGRGAAAVVRLGLVVTFGAEAILETAKWLVGNRRPMRRARIATYARVLRDALGTA